MENLIIYGGCFDPPHHGHIQTALAVQNHCHFKHFLFLPCKTPVIKKKSQASPEQRLHMLELALAAYSCFSIDQREIRRDTPSYMVDTLLSFREQFGDNAAITLLLGLDAFIQLPQWHRWQQLLSLCHLLVMKRPNTPVCKFSNIINDLLKTHEIHDKEILRKERYGKIYFYDAGQYAISSSEIRQRVQQGQNIQALVPTLVAQYIKEQALYQ